MKRPRRREAALAALAVALLALAWLGARARAEPLLHEYIEHFVGQGSNSTFANTNDKPPRGERSPNGSTPGPNGPRAPQSGDGDGPNGDGDELGADSFRIDSDTSRPESVSYSDPFTPAVAPFKRLVAYDAVDSEFELFVFNKRLVPMSTNDRHNEATLENFHAAFELSLRAGEPARIPSVGPGARVRVAHAAPSVEFTLLQDSADNWFVRSPSSGALRLVLQLSMERRSFGAPWPDDVSFADLAHALPPVPEVVRENARQVAALLGIPQLAEARTVVARLVDHFRRFRPSERPLAGQGAALYRQLAISRRGVCRHRAYAFVVTALGLGIPARFVHNEAHAWVEVFDSQVWQRIDLGGAAGHVELDADARPRHVQPRDPFVWPDGSDSANDVVERSLRERVNAPDAPTPEPSAPGAPASSSAPAPPDTALAPEAADPAAPSAAGSVTLTVGSEQSSTLRGQSLEVSGSVAVAHQACRQVPVEVSLKPITGNTIPLGTLQSDDQGQFDGRLVVPWSLPVGDYLLSAESPEAAGGCGP